ncbi:sentrin-specific protease 1-like [Drosophila pseudoobscura]|uniref:Sentrin-specific protease 1-like n=1 Tax=Drosophila pseudoobscura pseudoobscura TaxID=46245 RepID=A0A6I8V0A2_DROPS|nr:sentrin-specific protease 1 [Drosophila pseudoobscura]
METQGNGNGSSGSDDDCLIIDEEPVIIELDDSSESEQAQSEESETEHQEEVPAMQQSSGLLFRYDFEKEVEFIPITDGQLRELQDIVTGPDNAPLITKYSRTITKKDIRTLTDLSRVNDTVINFYMNLLIERSQQTKGILPSVYSMSTVFLKRVFECGFDAVKCWTSKIDVFSKDIILVPVHCNSKRWCMAIIHFKNKTIFYYDSLGYPNDIALDVLKNYIIAESLDKRKVQYDMSGFRIENVLNGPQQTNGSDCGVFSCMTAEYI